MMGIIFFFAFVIAGSRFYQWYSEQECYIQKSHNTQKINFSLKSFDFEEPCIGCEK